MSSDLNGDLGVRVSMHSTALEWSDSPSGGVSRKRLHRVGPVESGQVTSIVRFAPGSAFSAHEHPDGEEILVLEGVFTDERGDWPAGSYLLSPEGFEHRPSSTPGCTLFVKLRQYGGAGRETVALHRDALIWAEGRVVGSRRQILYRDDRFPEEVTIERWSPEVGEREWPDGGEVFVLSGAFEESGELFNRGSWLRIPAGGRLAPRVEEGCEVYVKAGGVSLLEPSA